MRTKLINKILQLLLFEMVTKGELVATLGLTNGMIGGTILVIPLIGITTGFVFVPMVSIFYGAISCYTCYLITLHLGECKNVRESILQHFYNSHIATVIYNFVIGLSLLGFLINYFNLIVLQILGFLSPSPFIPIGVFVALMLMTILMRYLSFGQKLLALGIVSIIGYTAFLIWAQVTAPAGPRKVQPFGNGAVDLAASLIMGFAIHDFVAQILLKTTTPDKYTRVVIATYALGTLAYTFITYGCFAIINRQPRVQDPQTISEYFQFNGWQIEFIEIIYLIHLMTASPEFCIIMRIRWLQICKLEDTPKMTLIQFLVYFFAYGLCYILYAVGIKVATIIEINGSVIGVLYVFLIPIAVHIKCVYFSEHDQEGYMISEEYNQQKGQVIQYYGSCRCKSQYRSKFTKYCELAIIIIIVLVGIVTVFYTMKNLFFGASQADNTTTIIVTPSTIAESLWPVEL